MAKGTRILMILGNKVICMMFNALTLPAIHSMMVVTSPIGVQAPPALAAMTIMLAKNQRSCLTGIILLSSVHIMMVVVRLSRMADKQNASTPNIHNSSTLDVALIWSVMTRKPPQRSTTSTMVMAPSRKNTVSPVSPK